MTRLSRFDLVALLVLAIVLLLLAAGLSGHYRVFAALLVAWLGVLAGIGFVRAGQPATWLAALLAFAGLAAGMAGILLNESAVVTGTADTVLGFHPGTASLVYGIWLPGFFTLGVAFVLLFDRLADVGGDAS